MNNDKQKKLAEILEQEKAKAADKELQEKKKNSLSPRKEKLQARALLERSTATGLGGLLDLVGLFGGLIGILYLHYLFRDHLPKNYSPLLSAIVISLVVIPPILRIFGYVSLQYSLMRLRAIPYSWNREQFLVQLSEMRGIGLLEVRCFFASEIDSETQKLMVQTVQALCSERLRVDFIRGSQQQEAYLSITYSAAGIVMTKGTRMTSGKSVFSNERFHDRFVDIASRVLPKLDDVVPVKRIEANIRGEVLRGKASDLVDKQYVSGVLE